MVAEVVVRIGATVVRLSWPCSICIRFVNETGDLNTQISTGVER